ncbi:hypothetical protein GHT06_007932 [Daphnia sinensis]|uniref:Cuticular protein n=1 Tax=Daphnia sinensis TaxID=1820382 RepID=A0AAD5Q1J9_9CRUS|nr:hypothetical protein GHT06_007932 [Daphnia sinensis]
MSSSTIKQVWLLAFILMTTIAVRTVTATSYDKYDPGYGIYDDGFSNPHGYYHRMGQAKYSVQHGAGYDNRVPVRPISMPARTQQRVVLYGQGPPLPAQYHSMGFY